MSPKGTLLEQVIENGKPVKAITRKDGIYHLYHITESGAWVRVKSGKTPLKF